MRTNICQNKTKKVLLFALCLVFSLLIVFGIYHTVAIAATDVAYAYEGSVNATYSYGDTFAVPTGEATYQGKKYALEHTLAYPDGRESGYSTLKLDAVGKYTLTYSFKDDSGNVHTDEEKTFAVNNDFKSLFIGEEGAENLGYANLPDYFWEKGTYNSAYSSGVKMRFTQKDAYVRYNNVIDLDDTGKNDPFLTLQVTPDAEGDREFTTFYVTLTDVHNPDNYVIIKLYDGGTMTYYDVTYVAARSSNCEEFMGLIRFHDKYGSTGKTTWSSFSGLAGNFNEDVRLCYSYPNVYLSNKVGLDFVVNLADPDVVGVGGVWDGFSTNEVYVSFSADKFIKSSASVIVTSIGGKTLNETYYGQDETEFYVNYNGLTEDTLLKGVKGESYPVFDCVVVNNVSGIKTPTNVKVLFGGQEIPVKNGRFATAQSGTYTIVYESYDRGTYHSKEVEVEVVDEYLQELQYTVNSAINETPYPGETVFVYDGALSGGVGALTLKKELFVNGEKREFDSVHAVDTFVVERGNSYKVKYTVTDFLGKDCIVEQPFTTSMPDEIVITEPSLPDYVVKGHVYEFPTAKATYYAQDKDYEADVRLTIGGKDYTDKAYTVAGDFVVKYTATVAELGKTKTWTKTIRALQVGTGAGFVKDYFTVSDVNKDRVSDVETYFDDSDKEGVSFKTSVDGAYVEYANVLTVEEFKIQAMIDEQFNAFDSVDFYLQDGENTDIVVKISLKRYSTSGKTAVALYVNDEYRRVLSESGFGSASSMYTIGYDNKKTVINDTIGGYEESIGYTVTGAKFEGFTSGKIYFKAVFAGVFGTSSFRLKLLSNQKFLYSYETDRTAPIIVLDDELPVMQLMKMGDSVYVPSAKVYDVLSTVKECTITVLSPSGKIVYEGAADKNASFNVVEYGNHEIHYVTKDVANRKAEYVMYAIVVDHVKPIITVGGNVKTQYSVGETLELPSYSATDNIDEEVKVYVSIMKPDGLTEAIRFDKDGNVLTVLEEKGTYTLRFYAVDSSDNFTNIEMIIYVK